MVEHKNRAHKTRQYLALTVAGLLGTTSALATDFNGTATVVVQSGITIMEVAAMNFGTIGVKFPADMPGVTKVTMTASSGALNSNNSSNVLVISDGTALSLAISNAPPAAALSLVGPSTTLIGTGSNNPITLDNFINDIPLTTDANGNLSVKFGADITFEVNSTYGSGTYTGSYTLQLSF